jgi:hypothetical protein
VVSTRIASIVEIAIAVPLPHGSLSIGFAGVSRKAAIA